MALAIDTSTPPYATSAAGVTSLTTASFTPPTGALLVVCATNASARATLSKPTNTGGTVSWANAVAITGSNGNPVAAIWLGTVTVSSSMTVTAAFDASAGTFGLGVPVITGQAATQNGATNSALSTGGLPAVTLSSLAGSNSLVIAAFCQSSSGTVGTSGTNQSQTFNGNAYSFADTTNGNANWVQYDTRMNLSAGSSDTINDTAPSVRFQAVAIEIVVVGGVSSSTFTGFIPSRMPLGA